VEEVYRHQATVDYYASIGKGIQRTLHKKKLAGHIILLHRQSKKWAPFEIYKKLGEKWKSMNPDNCWGGDLPKKRDAMHFSRTHGGVK
jgi:hypothetical protein